MSDPVNTASFGSLEDLPEDKMSRNEPHSDKYEVASKIYKERVAAARKRRQTPKEYNSDQHIDRPHCSLSISGPATLSLSEPEYAFTVTLHYHSEPQSTSQPIVVRTSETALDVHTPTYDADAYVMYRSPDVNHEDRLQHYIVSICYRNIPGASSKFSITPGNGFIELAPGETVKREVRLESRMFEKFLKPGEKRYLLYTGAGSRNVIRYWRYGTLESLKDEQADYDSETREGGIVLPRSNIIEIMVVD